MNPRALIICAIAGLALSGCTTTDLKIYGIIDQSEKTITVPAGGHHLKGSLKEALREDGWQLVVDRGPTITSGLLRDEIDLETADTFHTRYRLLVAQHQFDICFTGSPALFYDISVIDNETGSEVFTLSGKHCGDAVVDAFMDAMRG